MSDSRLRIQLPVKVQRKCTRKVRIRVLAMERVQTGAFDFCFKGRTHRIMELIIVGRSAAKKNQTELQALDLLPG